MNLGEALSLLKKEKSKLVRLISLRKENIYFEEGTKPEFDTKKLTNEIDSKIEDIRKLKIKIEKTNLNTKLSGDSITISEAIIKVGDIRSKLSSLSNLFERKRSSWYLEKDTKRLIAQISESEIEDEIEKLEIEKGILDNKLQMTNWNTKLSE
ncbi:MAG: DIP1984 family protein [Nanoarchaeota archaeon]|nr:DIP1984 family protein [Nanoarchaeota archaeon]